MMKPAFLFDLDGTLLDTADDLVAALNHVRRLEGHPPIPSVVVRQYASRGARGLLDAGFGEMDDEQLRARRTGAFLDYYAANHLIHTRAFEFIDDVLSALDEREIPWGIVTNKAERLTLPLLQEIGWRTRPRCIVCGDTTAHPKPHPLPVLHACAHLGVPPGQVWMIGDDARDIEAGQAAGCRTAVAAWGYLGPHQRPEELGGDVVLDLPRDIFSLFHHRAESAPYHR